jgi:hypothetical protein
MRWVRVFGAIAAVTLSPAAPSWADPATASDAPEVAEPAGLLDGREFVGVMGREGSTRGEPDAFLFEAGHFRSIGGDRHEFQKGQYEAQLQGSTLIFTAQTRSPTHGVIAWQGTFENTVLSGTAVWDRPGRPLETYWFTGTLKDVIVSD